VTDKEGNIIQNAEDTKRRNRTIWNFMLKDLRPNRNGIIELLGEQKVR
jgi:hypothetical protein